MRTKIVAGNWKMNLTFEEADNLVDELMSELEQITLPRDVKVVLCPPAVYLEMVSDYAGDSYFMVGAQDVSEHEGGAYTGEVSAAMLASCEADYCIVGHSERRTYHGESDQVVAAKASRLLEHGLMPIVCVGEQLSDRDAGQQLAVVQRQVEGSLFHLDSNQIQQVVVAYEPVWAIGTGRTATAAQAQEMHQHIRSLLAAKYGQAVADEVSILYGGSCKPSNAAELFACPDVDGGLIGGASLKAKDFMAIINAIIG
ncbi:MAG: triose-phosphate isomerase [Bacteroidales bacterium]|nr:triose-phosphate isomerase [Bacteroidales bacterium]